MKTITKGKNMNNFKKVGLTALAGSLAAISANAAEMSVRNRNNRKPMGNENEPRFYCFR
jgi:hypothetical protein